MSVGSFRVEHRDPQRGATQVVGCLWCSTGCATGRVSVHEYVVLRYSVLRSCSEGCLRLPLCKERAAPFLSSSGVCGEQCDLLNGMQAIPMARLPGSHQNEHREPRSEAPGVRRKETKLYVLTQKVVQDTDPSCPRKDREKKKVGECLSAHGVCVRVRACVRESYVLYMLYMCGIHMDCMLYLCGMCVLVHEWCMWYTYVMHIMYVCGICNILV